MRSPYKIGPWMNLLADIDNDVHSLPLRIGVNNKVSPKSIAA
jgi:hypothetical protein